MDKPQTTNTTAQPKYTRIYLLEMISCKGCGIMLAIPPGTFNFTISPELLIPSAEAVHKQGITQQKVVCFAPQLIFTWKDAMCLTKLLT